MLAARRVFLTWGLLAIAGASAGWAGEADSLVSRCERALKSGKAEEAVGILEQSLSDPATDAVEPAETLWQLAQEEQLTDELADLAARLLDHEDPFVRALAEWAIAIRVGCDNSGPVAVWPKPDPPAWFTKWLGLDGDRLLDADYARLAITWDLHRDGRKLLGSVDKIIQRAQGAASDAIPTAAPETRAMIAGQLDRLRSIRSQLAGEVGRSPRDLTAQRRLWLAARRAVRPIVLANPAIDFRQIAFTRRHSAHSHRNITGSQYPWIHKPGGDISVKTGLDPADPVRDVIGAQLGPGHVHGMDLWWDADRLIFAYARQPTWPPEQDVVLGDCSFELRRSQEPTHLYEVGLDGHGLRQVTNHATWNDFEPTYAADGRIVFASDRSGRSSECGKFTADHTVINLYSVGPDGKGLRRLSDNKDIDRYPHSLDDGTIAYTRWEYQERHFFEVHSIWRVRPDGTMADAVFGQHMPAPYSFRDIRSVPGSTKLVSIATGHHTFAYGPVVIVDPRAGLNAAEGLRVLTPQIKPEEGPMAGRPVDEGGVPDRIGLFETPWALSDKCFLTSYSAALPASNTQGGHNATGFAVYLVDVWGNKELIHRDPIYSCEFPMPVRGRPQPPRLPDATQPAARVATCYVSDVYRGLEGVPQGAARYVRISQRVGWPLDEKIGAMRYIPGNAWEKRFGYWEWAPVRVIGTVPVEKDGSAHFEVPVDTSVYFQLLDENHLEIRRMRSHISLQPGEVRGCTGCHESQAKSPAADVSPPLALRRPASRPEPPRWGAERLLGYEWMVQPILDRRCVQCHGREQPDGGLDFTSTRADDGFCQSFHTLFPQPRGGKTAAALVSLSNRFDGAAVTQPKQFGSHRSALVRVLVDDDLHRREARLTPDEWIALVTWVDANAPYYDTFFNKRPEGGEAPVRNIVVRFPADRPR